MPDYIQIVFENISVEEQELLVANLAEAGYEGFEEGESSLKAFIAKSNFDLSTTDTIANEYAVVYTTEEIPSQNWNAVWESNFEPVIVDDFVSVVAHFHEPVKGVEHEIKITPKMSFGTGHHATTFMMMRQMRSLDFKNQNVFDFGTGTGVLAILADKLGAAKVLAIDNDDWSIENARENVATNQCKTILVQKGDSAITEEQFGIVLANINKNVILENFAVLVKSLQAGGVLLISGLLAEDKADIVKEAEKHNLSVKKEEVRSNWLCLNLSGR
jgi:ribosomal protein L11 methyltransferase